MRIQAAAQLAPLVAAAVAGEFSMLIPNLILGGCLAVGLIRRSPLARWLAMAFYVLAGFTSAAVIESAITARRTQRIEGINLIAPSTGLVVVALFSLISCVVFFQWMRGHEMRSEFKTRPSLLRVLLNRASTFLR